MKPAYTATAISIALLLGACQRESTTVVAPPPAPAASSSATTGVPATTTDTTAAASGAAGQGMAAPSTAAAPADYNAALNHLQQAAQRLRDATHAMAKEPAGDGRNKAIREANEALLNVNSAMSQVYKPDMGSAGLATGSTGTAGAAGSGGYSGGAVYPKSDAEYTAAMERLQKAAQHLRESIQSMAQLQSGPQRDAAMKQAHQALNDTNQAMIQLPPEMRTEGKS